MKLPTNFTSTPHKIGNFEKPNDSFSHPHGTERSPFAVPHLCGGLGDWSLLRIGGPSLEIGNEEVAFESQRDSVSKPKVGASLSSAYLGYSADEPQPQPGLCPIWSSSSHPVSKAACQLMSPHMRS